jgi:hypothetical protein
MLDVQRAAIGLFSASTVSGGAALRLGTAAKKIV